jgi:hypothetical protein
MDHEEDRERVNVTEVNKIVVEPSKRHLLERITAAAIRQKVFYQTIGLTQRLKLTLGQIVHPLGIHTWVSWKSYDEGSDRIIDTGGKICEFCPKARLGR